MRFRKTCGVAFAACLGSMASAQSFTLAVDPQFYDLDNGPPYWYPGNPQSVTFTSGTNGVSTSMSTPDRGGFLTSSATITASIIDANHGTINYNDAFNVINAPVHSNYAFGAGDIPDANSNLTFTTATPVAITIDWTSTCTGLVNGALDSQAGLMQNVWIQLDGIYQTPDSGLWFAYQQSSGSFLIIAGAGSHTLTFVDGSNNGIAHGASSQSANLQESMHYSIQSVPEPATLAALGLGVIALLRRRRR